MPSKKHFKLKGSHVVAAECLYNDVVGVVSSYDVLSDYEKKYILKIVQHKLNEGSL